MRKLLFILVLTVGHQLTSFAQTCTGPLTVTVAGATTNQQLSGTETHEDLSCNAISGTADGTINITPEGGSSPYTFDWGDIAGTDDGEDRMGLSAGDYSVTIMDANGCNFEIGPITLTEPSPVAVGGMTTQLACNSVSGDPNGAIDITASGGTIAGKYQYAWSTTDGSGLVASDEDQTELSAGTYTVVVTDDNECTVAMDFTLTEPSPVTVGGMITNLSCNSVSGDPNGAIDITAGGGTVSGSHQYAWSTTDGSGLVASDEDQTELSAGTYTVVVTDDNNCTVTMDFTLTEPLPVTVGGMITNLSCNSASGDPDGAIDIAAGGGTVTGSYQYAWSTTDGSGLIAGDEDQTELSAGTYTVIVTDDNNCTVSMDFTLTEPTPVAAMAETSNPNCNASSGAADGTIDLMASGGTVVGNYQYNWTTNDGSGLEAADEDQSGLSAGTYKVLVTDDKGCTVEESFTLTEPNAVSCMATSPMIGTGGFNILCAGGFGTIEVAPSGGSGTGYTFSINGTDFQPDSTFTDVLAGSYTITTKDDKGCTSTCDVTLTEPTALVAGSCDYVQDLCQLSEGEIKIEASGGVAPYSVAWTASPVAPNTTAGSLTQSTPQTISASGESATFTGAEGNNEYMFVVSDANGCQTP